jgi:hypothetical protein
LEHRELRRASSGAIALLSSTPNLAGLIRLLARLAARDESAALAAETKESVA